jgi:hypothetical protein
VNNPLVDTQSTTTSTTTTTTTEVQEEISTEKEEETDVQWTLKAATDNELLKEDKEYHANQNYIDQDGKEQHYSVLMAKLYQTNNIKPIKKKGIKRKVSEFVSSCKERLSILQTKKTIHKRTLK